MHSAPVALTRSRRVLPVVALSLSRQALPRAQRRAAEVRAASARKAAAGSDEDHDSEDSDDYYDLLAAKERVRNGRVTLEGVPMDAAERRRRNFRVAGSPRKPASPVSATIRSAPALRSWPLGASARPAHPRLLSMVRRALRRDVFAEYSVRLPIPILPHPLCANVPQVSLSLAVACRRRGESSSPRRDQHGG